MLSKPVSNTLTRRGGMLQGCLIVVAILLVIAIAVGIFVAMNWRGWSASAMSAVATEVINESDLPDSEKPEIIAVFDEVAEGFRNKQVTFDELVDIFEGFEDAPVFWIGLTMQFEGAYVQPSGLSDEEKADAALTLNRVCQGLDNGQLTAQDAKDMLDPVTVDDADGEGQLLMPDETTDEQIREVIASARTKADTAGIPAEHVEIDLSEEFREYIEERLGRPLGTAPASE